MQCVLPNPPDYAKIGGHWEILASRTDHIKEGLVRFFCLIPYDVITLQVWNQAMSHWMEAIYQGKSWELAPKVSIRLNEINNLI